MSLSSRMTRRSVLGSLFSTTLLTTGAFAQTATSPAPFSFDWLKAEMKARAALPDQPPELLDTFLERLTYDDYRHIAYRGKRARWVDQDSAFQLQAFHPGWLFNEPVTMFEVVNGMALPLTFTTADFEYRQDLGDKVPDGAQLPGVAGLKINTPLNGNDGFDELITFLGASYFRALGTGNSYGLSARGLSIDTWLSGPEEFPRFSTFWVVRPAPNDRSLTVYAALDSASVTGAYRFVITPGDDTVIEVTSELNFRTDIRQLGIAPLTSMFYFSEHSLRQFDDFRPQVHDSDALQLIRGSGDVQVRPLMNPYRVSNSYFADGDLAQFGLIQRDRAYEDFQDAGAQYHNRPSVMIERVGDWDKGKVRLVEIPADLEIDDNIVMFWVPDEAPKAGESRTYAYKMHWGALPADGDGPLAYVQSTRTGVGGQSGVPAVNPNLRKFVVDFEGGLLGDMDPEAEITPVVTASVGEVTSVVVHKIDDVPHRWRLFFDVDAADQDLIELTAHVAGPDRKLSEVWLYQWVRDVKASGGPEKADEI